MGKWAAIRRKVLRSAKKDRCPTCAHPDLIAKEVGAMYFMLDRRHVKLARIDGDPSNNDLSNYRLVRL